VKRFILALTLLLVLMPSTVHAQDITYSDARLAQVTLTDAQITELTNAILTDGTTHNALSVYDNYAIYVCLEESEVLSNTVSEVSIVFYDYTSYPYINSGQINFNGDGSKDPLCCKYSFSSSSWSEGPLETHYRYAYRKTSGTDYYNMLYATEDYIYDDGEDVYYLYTNNTALPTLPRANTSTTATVYLEQEATNFSANVPLSLPIALTSDGTVVTATNASIVNTGSSLIKCTNVSVIPEDGWNLFDYSTNITASDFGSQKVAIAVNGTSIHPTGAALTTISDFRHIAVSNPVSILYDVKIPAQKSTVQDLTVANIVFTLSWDGFADQEAARMYELAGITLDSHPYYVKFYYDYASAPKIYAFTEQPTFTVENGDLGKHTNTVPVKGFYVKGLYDISYENTAQASPSWGTSYFDTATSWNFDIYDQNTGALWRKANC